MGNEYHGVIPEPWTLENEGEFSPPVVFGATWIGSPNWGYPPGKPGRGPYSVLAIVLHIAQGTLKGCDSYFQQTAPGGNLDAAVSAHFCVGRAGELHQYVDINDAAWANGIVEPGSHLPAVAPVNINPNLWTVSIEHEGFSGQDFLLSQLKQTISLCSYLCSYFNLRPSRETIIPHSNIAPQTRRGCPGPTFPIGGIIDVLRAERGMVPLLRTGVEG